jgi:uncharacterized membrane protein YgdD (TMEM256/DUF423 family)
LEAEVTLERLATWETGVRYQLVHGLGLLILGLRLERRKSRFLQLAAASLLTGILVFAGSLYVLVLTGLTWLGALAPVGGLALIAGWVLAILAFIRDRLTAEELHSVSNGGGEQDPG